MDKQRYDKVSKETVDWINTKVENELFPHPNNKSISFLLTEKLWASYCFDFMENKKLSSFSDFKDFCSFVEYHFKNGKNPANLGFITVKAKEPFFVLNEKMKALIEKNPQINPEIKVSINKNLAKFLTSRKEYTTLENRTYLPNTPAEEMDRTVLIFFTDKDSVFKEKEFEVNLLRDPSSKKPIALFEKPFLEDSSKKEKAQAKSDSKDKSGDEGNPIDAELFNGDEELSESDNSLEALRIISELTEELNAIDEERKTIEWKQGDIEVLQQKNTDLRKKLLDAQKQLKQKTDEYSVLNEKIKTVTSACYELDKNLSKNKEESIKKQTVIDNLNKEKSDLQNKNIELQIALNDNVIKVDNLNNQLTEIKQKQEQINVEKAKLQAELATVDADKNRYQSLVDELLSPANVAIKGSTKSPKVLSSRLAVANRVRKAVEQQANLIIEQNRNLKDKLQKMNVDISSFPDILLDAPAYLLEALDYGSDGEGKPASPEAGAGQPGSPEPGAVQPASPEAGAVQPASPEAGAGKTGSPEPGEVQPGSPEPGAGKTGTPETGAAQEKASRKKPL